ncbi:hypothetical protein EJ110_NYTH54847 [Nymphaea thermarum]|nr:hypothetical protein EJ110_NYTH54847 [Nymphaea thermarum]
MASSRVEVGAHHDHGPRPTVKRTLSNDGFEGVPVKSCVCAPPTHPGSFKCRLHRGHHHPPPPESAPLTSQPQSAVSACSTRTVEAQ